MSFALGSLGFLTKFDFEDHQGMLKKAVGKGVSVGLRLRFEGEFRRRGRGGVSWGLTDHGAQGTVMRAQDRDADTPRILGDELLSTQKTHQADGSFVILNEIVVDRGPNPSTPCPHIP